MGVLATAVLTVGCFPPYGFSPLALVALVPLLWAGLAGSLAVGWVMHWIGNWATLVLGLPAPWNHSISLGLGLLNGPAWGIAFACYAWVRASSKRPWDSVLLAMSLAVTFSLYPFLFPFSLAEMAVSWRLLAQPIEWGGTYSLDFFLGLANVLVFRLLLGGKDAWRSSEVRLLAALVGIWFLVAALAQFTWDRRVDSWPTRAIGLVQTNRPASIGRPRPEPGYSREYPYEFDQYRRLAGSGAEVVILPEGNFFGYAFWGSVKEAFHTQVNATGTPLIFHDSTRETLLGVDHYYNSSIFLEPGKFSPELYHKRNLVPFGESTPLVADFPWLKQLSGDFASSLSAGTRYASFVVKGMRFVPGLCYDSQFPLDMAGGIGANGAGKVFLFQSQDGWYQDPSQTWIHLQGSLLRAMENRVPLVHVTNNGPSIIAGPNGKFYYETHAFQEVNGIGLLPFDPASGGSFFSANPYLFIGGLRFILLIYLAYALRDRLLPPKEP